MRITFAYKESSVVAITVNAFITTMTPTSLFLKAQISLLEHNASKNLQIAGEKLANGQTARLLGPKERNDL